MHVACSIYAMFHKIQRDLMQVRYHEDTGTIRHITWLLTQPRVTGFVPSCTGRDFRWVRQPSHTGLVGIHLHLWAELSWG
jgi:hypothetical protein